MRQKLIYIKFQEKGTRIFAPAELVEIDEQPTTVWTLYGHCDESSPPLLPLVPVHRQGAFLEDYVHDWNCYKKNGKLMFKYSSRVTDSPVWVLLEYED